MLLFSKISIQVQGFHLVLLRKVALNFFENSGIDLHKDPEMAKYRDLITWADHLIFIFPIWWSGMPAILKGFIDRVFAADFAYSYKKVGYCG